VGDLSARDRVVPDGITGGRPFGRSDRGAVANPDGQKVTDWDSDAVTDWDGDAVAQSDGKPIPICD
jgi:hypothetical protein